MASNARIEATIPKAIDWAVLDSGENAAPAATVAGMSAEGLGMGALSVGPGWPCWAAVLGKCIENPRLNAKE
jgi:hypothetical protein